MAKDPKSRNTIKDDDWQSLRDRADKGNPDMWKVTDPKGTKHRKIANANLQKRNQN